MAKQAIWKFELPVSGAKQIVMPKGAIVLSVQNQAERLAVWALVDPDALKGVRRFFVALTGQTFDSRGMTFVGTTQFDDGAFVAHVFEVEG